jgi:single-stranded-DNA-specific exonuclease
VVVQEPISVLACSPSEHTEESLVEIGSLGPFGNGNPRPLFFTPKGETLDLLPLGKEGKHYRIRSGDQEILAFNAAGLEDELRRAVGWIYRPRVNYWHGRTKVDMLLENVVVP